MAAEALSTMKVKRMPVSDQVYETMKNTIKEGIWKSGEKIPSEMELSEAFGVNRLTVRMAIQRLVGMDLLESRVGDGTYVKEFSLQDYMGKVSDFYLGPELLDKICEYRNTIEIESARLATERSTQEDIAKLEEVCVCFEEAKKDYLSRLNRETCDEDNRLKHLVQLDVEFHRTVCEMSHNDLFVYAFDMAKDLLSSYIENSLRKRITSWKEKKTKGIIYEDMHRGILNAIKSKDFDTCRQIYSDMVNYKKYI